MPHKSLTFTYSLWYSITIEGISLSIKKEVGSEVEYTQLWARSSLTCIQLFINSRSFARNRFPLSKITNYQESTILINSLDFKRNRFPLSKITNHPQSSIISTHISNRMSCTFCCCQNCIEDYVICKECHKKVRCGFCNKLHNTEDGGCPIGVMARAPMECRCCKIH